MKQIIISRQRARREIIKSKPHEPGEEYLFFQFKVAITSKITGTQEFVFSVTSIPQGFKEFTNDCHQVIFKIFQTH